MHLQAFSVSTPSELAALLAAPAPSGRPYALALVFATINRDPEPYQAVCRAAGVQVCGCSSAGEIADGQLSFDSVSGLLFDLPEDRYKLFVGDPSAAVAEQADALGRAARAAFAEPETFLLTGGLTTNGEEVIARATAAAGGTLRLTGGLAADDFSNSFTYCFSDSVRLDPGLVAIVFDGEHVELRCDTTSGWEPLGDVHTITHAEGNVIYTINNEAALPFFRRFFGEFHNSPSNEGDVSVASALYPLQLLRPEGALLRAPLQALEEQGAISLAGGVRTGDRFRFSISPGFQLVEETVDYFAARVGELPPAAGTVVVSCKGRQMAFGPMLEDELELVNGVYGNVPSAGFLSYGEIGPIEGGATALHNETCCVVAIRPRASLKAA